MTQECMCGEEPPTQAAYRRHVRRRHGSASYGAWKVL